MEFFTVNNLFLFLIFFIPGFVSLKVHDLLIASEKRDFSKSLLEVVAFSCMNLALLSWFIWILLHYQIYNGYPWSFAFCVSIILFVFPAILPIMYVKLINSSLISKRIVHPIKRPWDWVFSKKESYWVIITLKDGRKIGGVFSDKSYASSYPLPEQIYLEEIWKLDAEGHFIEALDRSKGVIILSDISTLEFFN